MKESIFAKEYATFIGALVSVLQGVKREAEPSIALQHLVPL
jgi:hypothetical protein